MKCLTFEFGTSPIRVWAYLWFRVQENRLIDVRMYESLKLINSMEFINFFLIM